MNNGNFEAIRQAVNFASTAKAELTTVRRDLNVAMKSGLSGAIASAQGAIRTAEEKAAAEAEASAESSDEGGEEASE